MEMNLHSVQAADQSTYYVARPIINDFAIHNALHTATLDCISSTMHHHLAPPPVNVWTRANSEWNQNEHASGSCFVGRSYFATAQIVINGNNFDVKIEYSNKVFLVRYIRHVGGNTYWYTTDPHLYFRIANTYAMPIVLPLPTPKMPSAHMIHVVKDYILDRKLQYSFSVKHGILHTYLTQKTAISKGKSRYVFYIECSNTHNWICVFQVKRKKSNVVAPNPFALLFQ
jgi:hypothetical protein